MTLLFENFIIHLVNCTLQNIFKNENMVYFWKNFIHASLNFTLYLCNQRKILPLQFYLSLITLS